MSAKRAVAESQQLEEPTSIDPGWLQKGTHVGYYEIVDRVGSGGFGALYKAVRDGKVYALKIANRNVLELPDDERRRFEERIEREVVSLMSLRHPNIVRVYAYDRWPDSDGFQYIVMEFVAGYRIGDWCAKQTPSLRSILNAFRKLALALAEMHRLEIYHRDLKHENVMVRAADEEPFLVDFGISRPRSAVTVTREMSIFGTYTHFSPEYCNFFGSEEYLRGELFPGFTPATELWSFGVLLYEVLTGVLPFAEHSKKGEMGYLEAIQNETPKHPGLVNPKIPDEVDAFVLKFLEKRPQDRFQDGYEVAEALEKLLQTEDPAWNAPFEAPSRRNGSRASGVPASGKPSTQTRPARPQPVPAAVLSADGEAAFVVPPPVPSDASVDVILSADVVAANHGAAEPPRARAPDGASRSATRDELAGRAAAAAHAQVAMGIGLNRRSAEAPAKPPLPPGPFSPPTAEKTEFLPPEAASQDRNAVPDEAVASAPGAADIAELRKKLTDTSKPSASRGVIAAAAGVLLVATGVLYLASRSEGPATPAPQSLLQKAQASQDQEVETPQTVKESTLPPGEEVRKDSVVAPVDERRADDSVIDPVATEKKTGSKTRVSTGQSGDDAEKIDAMLKEQYGRPVIPGPAQKNNADGTKSGPKWLLQAEEVEEASAAATGEKRYGIPMGEHIKVTLKTNLDSRNVADGPVEAMLSRPHVVGGVVRLPSRTMAYGTASTSGGRFVIRFTKLRLPDHTEIEIKGLAFDIAQKRPGLAPSRRISGSGTEEQGVAVDVVKGAANTLLGKTGEGTGAELAQGAGQTVLRGSSSGASGSAGEALLLDTGAEFAVFVEEAF